ncbi:MAG: LptA/OstA family protein [Parvibaculaceae bacterium]
MKRRASLAIMSVLAGLAFSPLPALAQTVDAAEASKDSKTPRNVDIEADSMEILDEQKKAIFKGNVNAKRGNVTLKCDTLVVTYTETAATPTAQGAKQQSGTQAAATDGGTQAAEKKTEVTFLDAEGNVVIVTQRQTVTGKTAHMDVKANKLWVKGGAKVVQGKTVMNGQQLFVDLNTNKSEMTGGRVKGSFVPGQ